MLSSFLKKYRTNLLTLGLLVFLVFVFFYPTIHFGFFSDDYHFLYITSRQSNVLNYFLTNNIGGDIGGTYGPMLNIIFTAEYKLFGFHYFFYHIFGLVIYALTAFFVFLFAKNISNNKMVAWVSALLFIFLQNHASTISWVAIQPHLLATFFFVLFLYFYHRFIISSKNLFYILALFSIVFSLFIKEIAITFPALVVLIDLFFSQKESIKGTILRVSKRLSVFVLVFILYLLIRYGVVGYVVGYYGSEHLSLNFLPKLKMFVDIVLSMFVYSPYRQTFKEILFKYPYILGFLFFFITLVTWFVSKKYKDKVLWFSFLSFFITVLPFLNVNFSFYSDEGERYAYLVSVFFVIFLAQFFHLLFSKLKISTILYFSFVGLFVGVSLFEYFHKEDYWVKSALIRDNMLNEFAEKLDKSKNNYFIFLAMPDNFSGAQLTRNGVLDMFKLENNFFGMSGERVTIYTLPTKFDYGQKILDFSMNDDFSLSMEAKVKEHVFTGEIYYFSYYGKFSLENYNKVVSIGESVVANLSKERIEKSPYDIQLVYFDGQRLNFVALN